MNSVHQYVDLTLIERQTLQLVKGIDPVEVVSSSLKIWL